MKVEGVTTVAGRVNTHGIPIVNTRKKISKTMADATTKVRADPENAWRALTAPIAERRTAGTHTLQRGPGAIRRADVKFQPI